MRWRILKDGTGVIVERNPVAIEEKTKFKFDGIPPGYIAIFKGANGSKVYAEIEDGKCTVPASFLRRSNNIRVAVSTFKGERPITCEGIRHMINDGKSFIIPDDNNLPEEVARIRVVIDEIRTELSETRKKFEELLKRVSELEGFDI